MNVHKNMSPRSRALLAAAAATAICIPLISSAAATPASPAASNATSALMAQHRAQVYISPNGNRVEIVDPGKSTYIPNIAGAAEADLAKAKSLHDRVNEFCRTHTAKQIKNNWRPGGMGMGGMHMRRGMDHHHMGPPTHYFNPRPQSNGLHPMRPKAALIYEGKLGGVMLNGKPLPYLGTIPRAHTHAGMLDDPVEMVHIYCTKRIKAAFTPNRTLGVLAGRINLRLMIRPAIMDLGPRQLRNIRDMVRHFMGHSMKGAAPAGAKQSGPDPVLQAMRMEIRKSLMMLSTHQLRVVWNTMQRY